MGTYYAQIFRRDAGKVSLLALKTGYRQFLAYGLHAELTVSAGWRHESDHPGDGATLDDLAIRAWPMVGYQFDVSSGFYVNSRAGAGIHIYRSTHADQKRKLVPTADVNVGVRF